MLFALALSALGAPTPLVAKVDRVPEDFATIQEAVDHGRASVIEVGPGRWAGATIDRPVALRGRGAVITSGTRLDGLRVAFPLRGEASGAEISGFTFDCGSRTLDVGVYGSAQRLGAVPDRVTVEGNTFQGCVQGVTNAGHRTDECTPDGVDGGRYWLVQGNTFDGFASRSDGGKPIGGIGVLLYNAAWSDVLENTFTGRVQDTGLFTTSGVMLAGCWDCTVALNTFTVAGGTHYWSAVSNFGFYQSGAAASRGLIVVDNDARFDSAPHHDVSFRSYDSFDVTVDGNGGVALLDHTHCGDDAFVTFGQR